MLVLTIEWSYYVHGTNTIIQSLFLILCTTRFNIKNSTFCSHSVFACSVCISEQTAIISLYSSDWLVFITEICVCCVVRTASLTIMQVNLGLESVNNSRPKVNHNPKNVSSFRYSDPTRGRSRLLRDLRSRSPLDSWRSRVPIPLTVRIFVFCVCGVLLS